jgi:serine/threonine protein kinase
MIVPKRRKDIMNDPETHCARETSPIGIPENETPIPCSFLDEHIPLKAGERVIMKGNAYLVTRLIGQGVSAYIYLLTDKSGHPYALKVLRPECASPVRIERFERESALLIELSHPHLVKGYAGGTLLTRNNKRLHCILIEYVPGFSLDQISYSSLNILSVLTIISDIVCVLNYLYLDGRVSAHRDLKPANIMWRVGEHATLLDLGIAKTPLRFHLSVETQMVGTLRYMAPEQFNDAHSVDIRCDIYALGVILYEMLEHKDTHAASGRILMEQRFSRPSLTLNEECRSWWALDEAAYRALDELIRRLTATELALRYQTPDSVLVDLSGVLNLIATAEHPLPNLNDPQHTCRHSSRKANIMPCDREQGSRFVSKKSLLERTRVRHVVRSFLGISALVILNGVYALYAPLVVEMLKLPVPS